MNTLNVIAASPFMDASLEKLLQSALYSRGIFHGDIPHLDELIAKEAERRYREAYGFAPNDPADARKRLTPSDVAAIAAQAQGFRQRGYVFQRAGCGLIGVPEALLLERRRDSLLGRAVETSLRYIVHQCDHRLRSGQGLEFDLNVEELMVFLDPSGADPNTRATVLRAIESLAGLVLVFRYDDLQQRELTPVLKSVQSEAGRIRIAANEHFLGATAKLVRANAITDKAARTAFLKGAQYFRDSPTRILVSNTRPAYTRTQRNLQSLLFTRPGPNHTDQSGYKSVYLGETGKLIEKLGYGSSRPARNLKHLIADLKRVVEADAGGSTTPQPHTLLGMPFTEAQKIKLVVAFPVDFTSRVYPKLLEERANLTLLGQPYDQHRTETEQLKARWSGGPTGAELRDTRVSLGLTQRQVAVASGIGLRSIKRYEQKHERLAPHLADRISSVMCTTTQPAGAP